MSGQITTSPALSSGLSFQVQSAGATVVQNFTILTVGPAAVSITVPANAPWMTIAGNPAGASFVVNTPSTLAVAVNTAGLTGVTYQEFIPISYGSTQVTFPVALAVGAPRSTYSVAVIQVPSGGYTYLYGINDAGQVAGSWEAAGNSQLFQSFIVSPSGNTPIPMPPGNWVSATATAVNNSGQVGGWVSNGVIGSAAVGQAFIATPSGSALIPLPAGWTGAEAFALNNSGQVAGYVFNGGNPFGQAFIGSTSASSVIPLPPGWVHTFGRAVNDSGQVAGDGSSSAGVGQAFIGTTAGVAVIPLPSGWADAEGFAVNNSGQVAGVAFNGTSMQAFIGTATEAAAIPYPTGTYNTYVTYGSINDQGFVVGTGALATDWGVGWIWDAVDGSLLLNTLVPAGWTIGGAYSISDNGIILADASYNGAPAFVELIPGPGVALASPGCTFSITPPSLSFSSVAATASATVTTAAGCGWRVSSNSSWLNMENVASWSGTGSFSFLIDANPGPGSRSGNLTVAGQTFTVTQAAPTLAPTGVTPNYPQGVPPTFTFTFVDPAGFSDISVVDILINDYLDGQHACYIALVPVSASTGYLYLVDDAGDGGYAGSPMYLPSSGTLHNSQCSINATGSTISASGNTLTLTLVITFQYPFIGNKIFYMAARSNTQNSGWQALGTWNIPVQIIIGPSVAGMSPTQSSTTGETYNFGFADTNGYADLSVLDILTNSFLDGISACYIAYVPTGATTGYLYLVDDAGDGGYVAGSPVLLSSGATLQNSQCAINTAGSSASASGNNLNLNLAITFKAAFAGNQVFYLAARNNSTGNSGWQAVGSVTVP